LSLSLTLRPTVQSASLSWNKALIWALRSDINYYQTVAGLLLWGAFSDERTGLSFTIAAGPRRLSHSRIQSPMELATIFYCFGFETSLFVASYDSQGYGGGIGPRLHTGFSLATNSLGSDPIEHTIFFCRVLLCFLATRCSLVHRERSSCCCVFVGTCILSRCLAVGRNVTIYDSELREGLIMEFIATNAKCQIFMLNFN
jgi:hypothetical protein